MPINNSKVPKILPIQLSILQDWPLVVRVTVTLSSTSFWCYVQPGKTQVLKRRRTFQTFSFFAKTNKSLYQTEKYGPGLFKAFIRMGDLMLPWQQMHRHAGTCNEICPPCEPRRWKSVTCAQKLGRFWCRWSLPSWYFYQKLEEVSVLFWIQQWCTLVSLWQGNTHGRADTIKPSIQEERDRIICVSPLGNPCSPCLLRSSCLWKKKTETSCPFTA